MATAGTKKARSGMSETKEFRNTTPGQGVPPLMASDKATGFGSVRDSGGWPRAEQ